MSHQPDSTNFGETRKDDAIRFCSHGASKSRIPPRLTSLSPRATITGVEKEVAAQNHLLDKTVPSRQVEQKFVLYTPMAWRSSSRGPAHPNESGEHSLVSPTKPLQYFHSREMPPSFVSFVHLSIFTIANHFYLNHFFSHRIDHSGTRWLGKGASFRASVIKRENTPGAPLIGLPSSQILVVKMPKLEKTLDLDVERLEKRFADIILELRVLIHPPLRHHENIVRLEGIAWQHSLDNADIVVPCLLLEFAEYGTLADLLLRERNLALEPQLSLLFDIAMGLEALHKCSIVHGDVKPENILIFKHSQRRFVAKLGDFGYCLIDTTNEVDLVSKTDLYSYGLVAWQVTLGHESLFEHICSGPSSSIDDDLEIMKEEDMVIRKARRWAENMDSDRSPFFSELFEATLRREPARRNLDNILKIFWGSDEDLQLENAMWDLFPNCAKSVRQQTIAFIRTQLRQRRRKILDSLRNNSVEAWASPRTPLQTFTWLPSRIVDLDPSIQMIIIQDLQRAIEGKPSATPVNRAEALGLLGTLHICNLDARSIQGASVNTGLDLILQSSLAGCLESQMILYRAYAVCRRPVPPDVPIINYVKFAVLSGLRDPLEDLAKLDLTEYRKTLEFRRRCFALDEVDNAKTILKSGGTACRQLMLSPSVQAANSYQGNVEMNPIHIAATCGFADVVEWLIDHQKTDVNSLTGLMDTPLICACRQGHSSVLRILLRKGANAAYRNRNSENALHFLWCFEENIEPVCALLVSRGADLNCQAHRHNLRLLQEWDSTHCPGTPLHRAVARNHSSAVLALLRNGADPMAPALDGSSLPMTPIELACRFHNSDVLEIMLREAKINLSRSVVSRGSPLRCLVSFPIAEAAENTSRHGGLYQERLFLTLKILRRYGASFTNCDDKGTSALLMAVSHGHRNVVDFLIEIGENNGLNSRYGRKNFSLLHMAIEFGQMKMAKHLLKLGTDHKASAGNHTVLHGLASGITGEESLELAAEFIRRGVPIDGFDTDYETPLAIALQCSNFPLARLLLEHGANPNASFHKGPDSRTEFANTILGHLVMHPNDASVHQVSFFLEVGKKFGLEDLAVVEPNLTAIDVVAKEKPTREPAHGAFMPPGTSPVPIFHTRNDGACVKTADLLLRHFRSPPSINAEGKALALAAADANLPVVKFLIEQGIDPRRPIKGEQSAWDILKTFPFLDPEMFRTMPGAAIYDDLVDIFSAGDNLSFPRMLKSITKMSKPFIA